MDSPDLLQASDRQHLMLLYNDEIIRNSAEIDCINKGLERGQFCVYASVDVQDGALMSKFASRIRDYDRHVREGNLLIVNFMPFYASAAKADLTPFKDLKTRIETALKERIAAGKSGKALIVADAACHLSRHKQFDECVSLEGWWQQTYVEWARTNQDITIICAHPSSILEQHHHTRDHISHVHSLTIDLREFARPAIRNSTKSYRPAEAKPIRILVAEPEPDIQAVYKAYFRSLPVETVIVSDGRKCLEQARMADGFDMIIVDSHLKDLGGIEIAKKILEERPNQHIVLTTTHDAYAIRDRLKSKSFDADATHVLLKPFMFSQLLSLIKPAKPHLN